MALNWSHAVLYVADEARMMDFYTRVLGFSETDRGQIRGGEMEIIFMSQSPTEHHQLAFIPIRKDTGPSNTVAHSAFRVESLGELRSLIDTLQGEAVELRPVSHGNTWSVYFQDPEGNGIEVFCETGWHVSQPAGETWDLALDDEALMAWTLETFEKAKGFEPAAEFYTRHTNAVTS